MELQFHTKVNAIKVNRNCHVTIILIKDPENVKKSYLLKY